MTSELTPIASTAPVAPWRGGKRNLAKRLTAIIDNIPCKTYAEPFVGMGGIFLRRKRRATAEVINDLNKDVANLFRILQRHYPQFIDTMRFQLTTRAEFERLIDTNPDTLTDLERAARFLYLQRLGFGGAVTGRTFGVAKERPGRFDLSKLEPMLGDLHDRLAGVVIERLDYADFIARYDSPQTLFYLDPPYWGCEDDYGKELFSRDQFEAMADQIKSMRGRCLMSINDVTPIRTAFAGLYMESVATTYTAGGKGADRSSGSAKELIVSNFDLKGGLNAV